MSWIHRNEKVKRIRSRSSRVRFWSVEHYKATQLKVFLLYLILLFSMSSLSKELNLHINKQIIFQLKFSTLSKELTLTV